MLILSIFVILSERSESKDSGTNSAEFCIKMHRFFDSAALRSE